LVAPPTAETAPAQLAPAIPAQEKSIIFGGESDSKSETQKELQSKKRESLLESVIAPIALNPSTRNANPVLQSIAPFDHIKLERLSVPAIIRFMDQALLHHARYRQVLPLPALLDGPIKESLTAMYGVSEYEYFQLSNEELLDYLQELVRPRERAAFLTLLKKYVKFKIDPQYLISVTDYKVFYDACLVYRKDFTRVLDFMSKDNKSAVPPCTNVEGGLVHLFLQKIPFQHGTILFNTLQDQKFSDFEDFLQKLFKLLAENFATYKRAKAMTYTFVLPEDEQTQPDVPPASADESSAHDIVDDVKPIASERGMSIHNLYCDSDDSEEDFRSRPKAKTKWKRGKKGSVA